MEVLLPVPVSYTHLSMWGYIMGFWIGYSGKTTDEFWCENIEVGWRRKDSGCQRGKCQWGNSQWTVSYTHLNPSTRFINALVYAGVGLTGAFAVIGGQLTVGLLSSFLSYSNQYTKPFNDVSAVITELQNAIACAGRIFELIEEKSQIPDAEDAAVLSDAKGNVTAEHV